MTGPARGGKVGEGKKAQHVDLHRKVTLRRTILRRAGYEPTADDRPLTAFVPYCGDGDLAVELDYAGRFGTILANDLDPKRVETFRSRIPGSIADVADADHEWPWPDLTVSPIALADLDAYSYPYDALRTMLAPGGPVLAPRLVVFLTDAQRMSIFLNGIYRDVDGRRIELPTNRGGKPDPKAANARRAVMAFYWPKHVKPAVLRILGEAGYTKVHAEMQYRRGQMLYAGIVVDRPPTIRVGSRRTAGAARDLAIEGT